MKVMCQLGVISISSVSPSVYVSAREENWVPDCAFLITQRCAHDGGDPWPPHGPAAEKDGEPGHLPLLGLG